MSLRPLDDRWAMSLIALAIALLSLAVAGRGMNDIPLESHEIYVAQTAENMVHSGDWLVPRLNGEYRLTKPPLSYWLVAGATLAAGMDDVSPGVARLPSVLAAMGMALLALWLGARLCDRRTGVLAALMTLASVAAFKYGHNARPDMLYAFWTTAVLAAWVGARQAGSQAEGLWIWGLWIAFGLATLTKGPQAPLILLLGLLVHAGLAGDGLVANLRRLRALRGVLIVLVMVVPWVVLLRAAIGGQTLGDSQLSGDLLTINPLRVFTPFYVLRTPVLWLPWALLLPCAIALVWRDRRGPAGMLGAAILFAMLAFALGPQYRQIYMLPWQVPAMIVFAAAALRGPWRRTLIGVVLTVVAVALVWLVAESSVGALWLVVPALLLVAAAGWRLRARDTLGATALAAGAFALGLVQGGSVPSLWSTQRYEELAFTRALSDRIDPGMPIVVWDIDPANYSYYLDRPVKGIQALDGVCDWLGRQSARTLLIYPPDRRAELARVFDIAPVSGIDYDDFAASWVAPGQTCRPAQE